MIGGVPIATVAASIIVLSSKPVFCPGTIGGISLVIGKLPITILA